MAVALPIATVLLIRILLPLWAAEPSAEPAASEAGATASEASPAATEAGATTSEASPAATEAGATTSEASPAATEAGATTSEASPAATEAGATATEAGLAATEVGPTTTETGPTASEATPAAPSETRISSPARPRSGPAPVTDVCKRKKSTIHVEETTGHWDILNTVTKLCVCDLLVEQCDVNCCCDPDCSAAEFSLFTTCSVPIVTGDSRLCSQKAAVYSLDVEENPPEMVFKLIDQVNPSIFCIHATNYKQALSFSSPEMPTSENFDQLLKQFGSATFSAGPHSWDMNTDTQNPSENETYRYEYGVPIQTVDGFLRLPSPVVSSWCSDANPAGFLVNQVTKCTRSVSVKNCGDIPAVTMLFYINSSILAVPKSSQMVNITVQSVAVQSPNGTRTLLSGDDVLRLPEIVEGLCINIVLGVSYHITYTEAGEIIEAAAAFLLGTINEEALSIQQSFEISFTQANTEPVPLSGNPGYVIGLPLRAGYRPQGSGIIQTTNKFSQLTLLQSTSSQDCLASQGARTPILFGYNMVSGCTLRITAAIKCQPLAQTLLDLLKGQSFPEYVASFGNSQAQDVLDWVPITNLHLSEQSSCQIPVSLEIEVKWTKYGSLVNPQARIVNVTATITTTTLKQLPSGRERTIPVMSSVVFTDVSSPAVPGYKAWPTINVNLPFDFFFPFV